MTAEQYDAIYTNLIKIMKKEQIAQIIKLLDEEQKRTGLGFIQYNRIKEILNGTFN